MSSNANCHCIVPVSPMSFVVARTLRLQHHRLSDLSSWPRRCHIRCGCCQPDWCLVLYSECCSRKAMLSSMHCSTIYLTPAKTFSNCGKISRLAIGMFETNGFVNSLQTGSGTDMISWAWQLSMQRNAALIKLWTEIHRNINKDCTLTAPGTNNEWHRVFVFSMAIKPLPRKKTCSRVCLFQLNWRELRENNNKAKYNHRAFFIRYAHTVTSTWVPQRDD